MCDRSTELMWCLFFMSETTFWNFFHSSFYGLKQSVPKQAKDPDSVTVAHLMLEGSMVFFISSTASDSDLNSKVLRSFSANDCKLKHNEALITGQATVLESKTSRAYYNLGQNC